jgi:quercetin dioxygenase-like cupin family protein
MELAPAYPERSEGFRRCELVGRAAGSVHMGVGLCSLGAGGRVGAHLHSFEESFYVLEGAPTLVLDGRAYALVPGACGVVPVGVPHAWLGPASGEARWIDMMAPQPRGAGLPADTFFLEGEPEARPAELDVRDPRSRHLFRLTDAEMVLDNLKVGAHSARRRGASSLRHDLRDHDGRATCTTTVTADDDESLAVKVARIGVVQNSTA